jgi:hypothetical protein
MNDFKTTVRSFTASKSFFTYMISFEHCFSIGPLCCSMASLALFYPLLLVYNPHEHHSCYKSEYTGLVEWVK